MKCKICSFKARNQRQFSSHLRWEHGGVASYYEKHEPKRCETCGTTIGFKHQHVQQYLTARFCSRTCCGKGPTGVQFGEKHRNWQGGYIANEEGYVARKLATIPREDWDLIKPMLRKSGYIAEHRYVMAKKLGRALLKTEIVHHINSVKNDNAPENLELWIESHPRGTRGSDIQCPCCGYTFNREVHGRRDVRKAS